MGNKGFTNRAKSGQQALPAKLRRLKTQVETAKVPTADRVSHSGIRWRRRADVTPPTGAPDGVEVDIDAYAGFTAEETPRRFALAERTVEVVNIADQWRTPDHVYYTVDGDDGSTYALRYHQRAGRWELVGSQPSR